MILPDILHQPNRVSRVTLMSRTKNEPIYIYTVSCVHSTRYLVYFGNKTYSLVPGIPKNNAIRNAS